MANVGDTLERSPIHRALSRPALLFGADRELVLLAGLLAVVLVFVVLTLVSAVLGCVLWIVTVGILRMMAKADPLLRSVYMRHLKYRSRYRPTATPWRRY